MAGVSLCCQVPALELLFYFRLFPLTGLWLSVLSFVSWAFLLTCEISGSLNSNSFQATVFLCLLFFYLFLPSARPFLSASLWTLCLLPPAPLPTPRTSLPLPRQTYPITRTITIVAKLSIKEVISPQWPMLWRGWAPLHLSPPCPVGLVPSAASMIASCSAQGARKPLRDSRWLMKPFKSPSDKHLSCNFRLKSCCILPL